MNLLRTGRGEVVQGERRVVRYHGTAGSEPQPCGHDVFVRTGGHTHQSVEAATHAFHMPGGDVVHEAAGAVVQFPCLGRREVASLARRQFKEPLELFRP